MKRVIYLLMLIMLSATVSVRAQDPDQSDNEKLTAYKIAFFTQRLSLTPAEAEKFWPLYNEFSARKTRMQMERISLMRSVKQNEAAMSDEELSATADKLAQTFVDEANLVVSFNRDLKKVLPPAKVIRLYQIESQYKQLLLKELNERRQAQQGKYPARP